MPFIGSEVYQHWCSYLLVLHVLLFTHDVDSFQNGVFFPWKINKSYDETTFGLVFSTRLKLMMSQDGGRMFSFLIVLPPPTWRFLVTMYRYIYIYFFCVCVCVDGRGYWVWVDDLSGVHSCVKRKLIASASGACPVTITTNRFLPLLHLTVVPPHTAQNTHPTMRNRGEKETPPPPPPTGHRSSANRLDNMPHTY